MKVREFKIKEIDNILDTNSENVFADVVFDDSVNIIGYTKVISGLSGRFVLYRLFIFIVALFSALAFYNLSKTKEKKNG